MILEGTRLVTRDNGPRPAGPPDRCFYCTRALGQAHAPDCVRYERTVKMRAVVEYESRVPAAWTPEAVEAFLNDQPHLAVAALQRLLDEGSGPVRSEYLGDGDTAAEWEAQP